MPTDKDETKVDAATIAKLFHETAFTKPDDTRITQKTLDMVSEYTKLFTDEAIVRANEDRLQESQRLADSYGTEAGDPALDARNLDAIAEALILDY